MVSLAVRLLHGSSNLNEMEYGKSTETRCTSPISRFHWVILSAE
jgi:hypothetical protein